MPAHKKVVKLASVLVTLSGAGLVAYVGLYVPDRVGSTSTMATSFSLTSYADLCLVIGAACIALGIAILAITEKFL